MREEQLHYVWKHQLFFRQELKTTDAEIVEIIKTGEYNFDSGPDFSNAHIRINGILFVGNIELHYSSSEWQKHKHHKDNAYNNVILHVVFEHDSEVKNANGMKPPTLQLKHRILPYVINPENKKKILTKQIACKKQRVSLNNQELSDWFNELYKKRIEAKLTNITQTFYDVNENKLETFYRVIASSFGFKTNSAAFELLSQHLPFSLIQLYLNNTIQLESLIFGVAGFLDKDIIDDYHNLLKINFAQLKEKHELKSLPFSIWKFSRMHPQNFPSIRLAQFSSLLGNLFFIYNRVTEVKNHEEWADSFKIKTSFYWQSHYDFGKQVTSSQNQIGELAVNSIIINAIVPYLFFYSALTTNDEIRERAFRIISEAMPEHNSTTKLFSTILPKPKNALQSQALIQLEKEMCSTFSCLKCPIGKSILNQ